MRKIKFSLLLLIICLFNQHLLASSAVLECSTFLQEYNKLISIKVLKGSEPKQLVGFFSGSQFDLQEWPVSRSFISLVRAQKISEVSQIIGVLRLPASTLQAVRYVAVYTLNDPVKQDPIATVALLYGKNHTLMQAGMVFKWLGAYRCD